MGKQRCLSTVRATALVADEHQYQKVRSWSSVSRAMVSIYRSPIPFSTDYARATYDLALIGWDTSARSCTHAIVSSISATHQQHGRIVVLADIDDEQLIVEALHAGAERIIDTSASLRIFSASVEAALRERQLQPNLKHLPPYVIDQTSRIVKITRQSVRLTPLEFRLFVYLMDQRHTWTPRAELIGHLWRQTEFENGRRLDIHVSKLRSKLSLDGTYGWQLGYDRKLRSHRLMAVNTEATLELNL